MEKTLRAAPDVCSHTAGEKKMKYGRLTKVSKAVKFFFAGDDGDRLERALSPEVKAVMID